MQKCSNIVFMQKNCLIQQSLILFDFYDCSILINEVPTYNPMITNETYETTQFS